MNRVPQIFQSLARVIALVAVSLLTVTLLAIPQDRPAADAQPAPTPPPQQGSGVCGSSVALVVDLSNSLTGEDLANVKEALRSLITDLAGAPYDFGLYTFATNGPAAGQRNVPATSLMDSEGTARLLAAVDALALPGGDAGGTNWQAGLEQVRNHMRTGVHYDTVYFITDGGPTFDNSGSNRGGNTTELTEIQLAEAAARDLEGLGARVIPIGVGGAITGNQRREIQHLESYWVLWPLIRGQRWAFHSYATPQQLLNRIATDSSETILVDNYAQLPTQMADNVVSGCLPVVKSIVDGDGTSLEPGSGWTFDLEVQGGDASLPVSQVTTNNNGVAEVSVSDVDLGSDVSVSITEQPRDGFRTAPMDGSVARCVEYDPGNEPVPVPVTPDGEFGIRVEVDPTAIIACTFTNRPEVSVSLMKDIQVLTPQLQNELNNRTYSFTYECRDGDDVVASGSVEEVPVGEEQFLATVPLGTECVLTESAPVVDAARYTVDTMWSTTNGEDVETSADGLTHRVRPTGAAHLSGSGAAVQVTNTFEAEWAGITLRKHIEDEESLPASRVPATFPVHYFCRYVPDPENPPEQGGGGGNPYFVEDDYVHVPHGGSAEIGPFPVGTQCGFEERSPAGTDASPVIDGFSLDTSWNSDICLTGDGASGTGLTACESNFVWIPEAGDHVVEVANSYERETTGLDIVKEVSGEAADVGANVSYTFDVVCTDGGEEVFTASGVQATPGNPTRVTGVPVAAECVVTERDPEIRNVEMVTAAPQTVLIREAGQVERVEMENTLNFRYGDLWLEKEVDISPALAPEVQQLLSTEDFAVQARCTVPGQAETIRWEGTLNAGDRELVGSFPLGTSCVITESYQPPVGVDHLPRITPASVTLSSLAGQEVLIENVFTPSTDELVIGKNVGATDPDLEGALPTTFTFSYTCSGGPSDSVTVQAGDQVSIPGILPGSTCDIVENAGDPAGLERTTTWSSGGRTEQSSSDEDLGLPSFTVNFPATGGGVSVSVTNTYAQAYSQMEVSKTADLVDVNGTSVVGPVRDAVITESQLFTVNYTCREGGETVSTGSFNVRNGGTVPVDLPVGTECEFIENAPAITATEGPEITYSGDGTGTSEGFLVDLTSGGAPRSLHINNDYVLQTGGFNLKKKVDGEGVATIHEDHDFALSYECTLNGVTVAASGAPLLVGRFDDGEDFEVRGIPVGSDCLVTESPESAQEEHSTWTARWTLADGPTGWENEQPCATVGNCRPTDVHHQASLRIVPEGSASAADAHFQGTLVVWNTYVYDKVNLGVSKELGNDGGELASGDTFTFTLVCTDPDYAGSELEGLPYIPDPTIRQTVAVTGPGDAVGEFEVPVGYDCVIRENPVAPYDATVTTTFDGADPVDDGTGAGDPAVGGAGAAFSTSPAYAGTGEAQMITVLNTYDRARASLSIAKEFGTDHPNSVHEHLNPGPFPVSWRCEDPYLGEVYSGTVPVEPGGEPVEVLREEATGQNDPRLPASALCSFTEDTGGRIPAGYEDVVNTDHRVAVYQGTGEPVRSLPLASIEGVSLDSGTSTEVVFTNSYWVPLSAVGLAKYVEGDAEFEVVPPDASFGFTYRCEFPNLLPGQPLPIPEQGTVTAEDQEAGVIEGEFTLVHADFWVSGPVPVGSVCWFTEAPLDPELAEAVDEAGLQMEPNFFYPRESVGPHPEEPDAPDTPEENPLPDPGDSPRIPVSETENGIRVGDGESFAVLFNSLYRADGEIRVQKVNPDGSPLAGAAFSIHRAAADGGMSEEPVVEDMEWLPGVEDGNQFSARLGPGSYYLVETRAGEGSELMPRPWRFDVEPVEAEDGFSDLHFRLSNYAEYSGLLEVAAPESGDPTDPWTIQVANIAAGVLPLTGGRGLWPGILLGAGLLTAAGLWFWRRGSRG